MEHKLFTEPRYHDAEFYRNIPAAPHWDQPGHGERLRMTFVKCAELLLQYPEIHSVADWGCGNGKLLEELQRMFTERNYYGCDLLPANVADAKARGFHVEYCDFVNQSTLFSGNLTILTEVLEHLIDPHGLLKRLRGDPTCRWIVASSPANETKEAHYPQHNWVWTDGSYPQMFMNAGWQFVERTDFAGAQIVVVRK